jgi:hypothetical protein
MQGCGISGLMLGVPRQVGPEDEGVQILQIESPGRRVSETANSCWQAGAIRIDRSHQTVDLIS